MKDTTKENSIQIPNYIEGIPTDKHRVKDRFELILSYYDKLWKDLQRETNSNSIHNKFLDSEVFIVKNESDKKTAREAMVFKGRMAIRISSFYTIPLKVLINHI